VNGVEINLKTYHQERNSGKSRYVGVAMTGEDGSLNISHKITFTAKLKDAVVQYGIENGSCLVVNA
jgi:hypothetical protein